MSEQNQSEQNNFNLTTQSKLIDKETQELDFSRDWNVGKIPNGGYLIAYVAKAMAEQLPHPHPLTVTGYYLDRTENGPATLHSEILREGKSISTIASRLMQEDTEKMRLTAAYTDFAYAKGESYQTEQAPKIADWEDCLPVSEVAVGLRMYDQFDMRFDPSSAGWNEGKYQENCEMNVWLSFNDSSKFDVFSLTMIPDMLPPAVFSHFGSNGWVPTIEMTVNVRAVPDTTRVQLRAKTRYLTHGVLEEDVEIWDDKGNILALSRQIAKLRIK